VKAKDMRCKV